MSAAPSSYDFQSPGRLSRERLRVLHLVNDAFARQIATVLSGTVRAVVHASVGAVDQTTYAEYVRRLPSPSLCSVVRFDTLSGQGVLQLPMSIVMSVIDRLLGGPGGSGQPVRGLSDIEMGLIRGLIPQLVEELTHAFEPIALVNAELTLLESDPSSLQVMSPADPVVVAEFEIRLGTETGTATLCLALSTLKPALASIEVTPIRITDGRDGSARLVEQSIQHVEIDVRVAFREVSLTSAEVFSLAPGDIIPLHQSVDEPLLVAVADVPVAVATPGTHGKRLACQVVSMSPQSSR